MKFNFNSELELNEDEWKGYDLASGVFQFVGEKLFWLLVLVIALHLGRNVFNFGIDDSDKDGFNRSGLIVHKDYKTGIEYLSDGKGGLIKRY